MLKKMKKGVAIGIGLACLARKRAYKELKKRGVTEKKIKGSLQRIGKAALKEGRHFEHAMKKEIEKEIKRSKPMLKKAVKKRIKKAKTKVKKAMKKARRR